MLNSPLKSEQSRLYLQKNRGEKVNFTKIDWQIMLQRKNALRGIYLFHQASFGCAL
jgi:hypothetical protein